MARLTNIERDRIKNDALSLYIRGYTYQSIAEMPNIKVGARSIREWAKAENWEEQKRLQNISPQEIKDMILKNVAAIKSGKAMPYKPDDIAKLASAWEKMDDSRKRAVYTMEAFMGFADWMLAQATKAKGPKREQWVDQLKVIRELQNEYLETFL